MIKDAEQKQPPAILAEIGLHAELAARTWIEAGFAVATCRLAEMPERLDSGAYNVAIVGRYLMPRKTKQQREAIMAQLNAALDRFVAAGGGLLCMLPAASDVQADELAEHLGAAYLPLRIADSEDVAVADKKNNQACAYTREVHPAFADDVRGLWYPTAMGHALTTRPLRLNPDSNWIVVAQGSTASHTVKLDQIGYGVPGVDIAGYESAPPFFAARKAGAGRVAVCGISGGYHLFAPPNFPISRQLMTAGFEGRPSDLQRLLTNVVQWLAEPSLASGALGGGSTDPEVLRPQAPRFPVDPPVIWPKREFPPIEEPMTGLIGARTSHSSGRGTPADYIARAKTAGHGFIVFLETFDDLTAESWQALKAECEAASTATFFAVPGYTIRDVVGTHFFQYGYAIDLPLPDLLTEDGRCLTPHAGGTSRNHRVENTHLSFIFGELSLRCRRGTYLHGNTPKAVWDCRTTDSFAVVTWESGKLIEDAHSQYPAVMDIGYRLHPVALTFMAGPDEFDAALASGWRNTIIEPYAAVPDAVLRKHMAPELERWRYLDEDVALGPRYRFDCWQYGLPFQTATNGPVIRAWTVSVSERDPEWRTPDHEIPPTADLFRLDVATFVLRIRVSAEAGLDTVILRDGPTVVRRWRCGGVTDFQCDLDLLHHQQTHLLLEAVDTRGGTAITSDYLTLRRDWCEYYCADRNNPLAIGYEKDEDGMAYGYCGGENLNYNNMQWGGVSRSPGRWWYPGDAIHPSPRDPVRDEISPFDGGVGVGAAGLHIKVEMPRLEPPEHGLVIEPSQDLVSPDVAIGGFICDHGYDRSAPYFFGTDDTGFGMFGVFPTRYVHVRRRVTTFRPKPHALTTVVMKYDLSFKRRPALAEPLFVGWLEPGAQHRLHRADGGVLEMPRDLPDGSALAWRFGEAVVSWTDGARPAIFINDGCDLLLARDPGRGIAVRLPSDRLPTPGAATTLRFIAIGGTHAHTDPAIVDRALADMGVHGTPAYQLNPEQGEILALRLPVELDAGNSDGMAFSLPRADLPMPLPLMVHGLNPRWAAFLVDRDAGRMRPLGMLEGVAYAVLDAAECDGHWFIGHPVTAADSRLVLSLVPVEPGRWRLEAHNPTDAHIETDLALSRFAALLDWGGTRVALAPGTSTATEVCETT